MGLGFAINSVYLCSWYVCHKALLESTLLILSRIVHPIYAYDGTEEEGYERQAGTEGRVDLLARLKHGNLYNVLWLIITPEVSRLMASAVCKISLTSTMCLPPM